MRKTNLLLFFFCSLSFTFFAQNKSSISLTEIMKGNHFVGHLPERIFWGESSQDIYFNWNPEDELLSSLYKTNANGIVPEKVDLENQKALPSSRGGDYNKARTKKVYTKNVIYFCWIFPKIKLFKSQIL